MAVTDGLLAAESPLSEPAGAQVCDIQNLPSWRKTYGANMKSTNRLDLDQYVRREYRQGWTLEKACPAIGVLPPPSSFP